MSRPPYDPYYFPPPPPTLYQHPPPAPVPPAPENGINTLFVSGLPNDVKPREIHNLFRRKHGFDSCQLKYTGRGNQVVAFATFFNHQSAVAALHELNGVKFDPQTGSVLHIEFARSNSRKKHKLGSGAYVVIDKRAKAATNAQETSNADGDTDTEEVSPRDNIDSTSKVDLVTTYSEKAADPGNSVASVNEQSEKTSEGSVQPRSTLFIANLGPNCTEDELKQALSVYPGFNMLKMRAKGGMPVAFADFEEIEQATKVLEELQGSQLPSSDRGMRDPKCGSSRRESRAADIFSLLAIF